MQFKYKAIKDNKTIVKKITADSEEGVISYLKKNNYFPVEVKKLGAISDQSSFGKLFDKVSFNDIVDLTRQIAIMLNAGLTLIDSFGILKKQSTKTSILKLITSLDTDIRQGNPLSSALNAHKLTKLVLLTL